MRTRSRWTCASGRYWVNVTIGDASYPRDRIQVKAEGAVKLANVTTAAGQWAARASGWTCSDNQLSLEFSDGGGDPYWVLNGLAIRAIGATATGPGGISFGRSGPNLDADGSRWTRSR